MTKYGDGRPQLLLLNHTHISYNCLLAQENLDYDWMPHCYSTNSLVRGPSQEASQKILHNPQNPSVNYHVHKSPPLPYSESDVFSPHLPTQFP